MFTAIFAIKMVHAEVYSGTCSSDGGLAWTLDSETGVFEITGSEYMWWSDRDGCPWETLKEYIKIAKINEGVYNIFDKAFSHCENMTEIYLPETLGYIGANTFSLTRIRKVHIKNLSAWCKITFEGRLFQDGYGNLVLNGERISNLVIPEDITEIKQDAFYGCGILSLTIPNTLKSIGKRAFGRNYLSDIVMEDGEAPLTIDSSAIFSDTYTENAYTTYYRVNINTIYIGRNLSIVYTDVERGDLECNMLREVTIGNSVTDIPNAIFSDCTYLNTVKLGNSVTTIGNSAFSGCTSLKTIDIPNSVTTIGSSAFSGCTSLSSIILPKSLTYIGYDEFYGCTSLQSVKILGKVNVDSHIYYESSNSSKIDYVSHAFRGCLALDTLCLPNAKSLSQCCFWGLKNLKYLELPFAGAGTAQTVGNFGELFGTAVNSNMRAVTQLMEDGTAKTYYLPTGLKELVIGEGCEQLPYGALYNCSMIEKLTLPTTIKGVKENALYGCDGLTDLYVKRALPPSAYETSFTGVNQFGCTLHVPHNSKQYYSIANGWKYFYFIEEEAPLTVSVAKSIDNGGEILGINQYEPGATAEMEAIAHSGYTFVGWYEDGQLLTTDSKYSFTVTESHTLVAQFASLLNENNVTVTPQSEAVTLSWEQEDGASSYEIGVYSDAAMTQQVGSMEVDQSGQVMTQAATQMSATVTGLSVSTGYYYRITAYDEAKAVLSQYTGTFSTIAGVEAVNDDDSLVSYSVIRGMLVVNGDGSTPVMLADMNGRVLYSGCATEYMELPLKAGIYILRLGSNAHKVVIR